LGDVNIHTDNDYAFRLSCAHMHKEIAEWLVSLGGVNIHAKDDYAFRYCCERGYLEIAKWLVSLGVDIQS